MDNLIFSGNARVQFEGDNVFNQMSINNGGVTIALVQVDGLRIVIHDHRPVGLGTMMSVMEDPQTALFSHHFHSPAQVKIMRGPAGDIRLDLYDTFDTHPTNILTISSKGDHLLDDHTIFNSVGNSGGETWISVHLGDRAASHEAWIEEKFAPAYVS